MINLKLIENQPHWRVALAHLFCRMVGVMVKVEGIPFGSARNTKPFKARGIEPSLSAQGRLYTPDDGCAMLGPLFTK